MGRRETSPHKICDFAYPTKSGDFAGAPFAGTPMLSVVVPCFNEEQRLPRTIELIERYLDAQAETYELILVDDGSGDGTRRVMQEAASRHDSIRVVALPGNRGKGRALAEGVMVSRGDAVLVTDADLSTPIDELPKLEAAVQAGAGVAIASRAIKGSRVELAQPVYRVVMGKVFNLIVQAVLLPGIWDTQCGFKLFRADVARDVFARLTTDGFAYDPAVLYLPQTRGVRVLQRRRKLGLGSGYEDALRIGLAQGAQLLVEMDGDGSHLAQNLDSIVDADRSSGGLAIGSRYVPGGSIEGWPFYRWLLSWGANVYCRLLLWLPTRDCTSGYRCYTGDLLSRIGLDDLVSQGYSFQIEMVWRTRRLGYSVVEVPIRFEDRVAGASKVSRGEVRRALWTVLRLSLGRWKR